MKTWNDEIAACVWGRPRAPRGLLAAVVGLVASLAQFAALLMVHLFYHDSMNEAGGVAALGALILLVVALALFVAEPIASVRARGAHAAPLRTVALTGRRRWFRNALDLIIATSGIALLALLVVERHVVFTSTLDPGRQEWFVGETYGLALAGPVAVVLTAARARRGYPRGVLAGLTALVIGAVTMAAFFLLRDWTHHSSATNWSLVVMFALIVLGPVRAIADVVTHTREQRARGPAGPELPEARVT